MLTINYSAIFRNNYTMLGVVFAAGFGFEMCVDDELQPFSTRPLTGILGSTTLP